MILPSSMKTMRLAISLAKFISWVTIMIVMPWSATSWISSKTSPMDSGSSAEVGSSKSRISGFIIMARMMAMRCFWPPDKLAV